MCLRTTKALTLLAALAGLPVAASAVAAEEPIAPARSGDVAICEELTAARAAGTAAAYQLFIARHPDHALAAVARRELRKLEQPNDH